MYMFLNELMDENDMSRAELSRISGVPESTLRDILNGKAQIDHCEAGTLMAIADALDTTVEEIVTNYWDFWESTLNPDEMEKIPGLPFQRQKRLGDSKEPVNGSRH